MSQRLISRSPDLRRLRNDGYGVEIRTGHLVIHPVPYVDAQKRVLLGTLVSELTLAVGDVTAAPSTHVMHFMGEYPCHADGSPIEAIRHASRQRELGKGLVVDHSFSARPAGRRYENYYDKVTAYVAIITGQAQALDPAATAMTFPPVLPGDEDSVFCYLDTASSRAEIGAVTCKLERQRIAIIGLGGTGSYVLDLVAKTPVREIHLFDGDSFLQHSAFRAPGAPAVEQFGSQPKKVAYFRDIYSRMRRGIVAHEYCIDASTVDELREMAFVFICVDEAPAKAPIVEALERMNIPFIDVGMGVEIDGDRLRGIVRTTTSTPAQRDHVRSRVSMGDAHANGDYHMNIQVADLNALNASLAVIRWKKFLGFYADHEHEHHTTYTIDGNHLLNEDLACNE